MHEMFNLIILLEAVSKSYIILLAADLNKTCLFAYSHHVCMFIVQCVDLD